MMISVENKSINLTSILYPLLLIAFIAATAGLGCVGTETKVVENRNSNLLCIQQENLQAEEDYIAADLPLEVYVVLDCASSDEELVDASCDVEVSESEISISSRFEFEVPRGPGGSTAECIPHAANCELPALAEGTYSVTHGDVEVGIDVPSAESLDCERASNYGVVPSPQE